MRLLFASQNRHKMEEIKPLLPESVELLCLPDLGFTDEIPETAPTLKGNALQKAQFIFDKFKIPCFADDTGLEIAALDGRPGVYSARYAGENKSAGDNIAKVLGELKDIENRSAEFKTVIALVGVGAKPLFFEGVVKGFITKEKQGRNGFGYDPVFMPEGQSRTFAEMSLEEKNKLSHRARAVKVFAEWMKKQSV
ncbi:MAG TPA: RdgB/HAM1 family non-canonical purine NTP pyrophosphatase [Bacteroidia bacterium]|jgi:XTP/dITP diphosphohydrolase|nr:RdgB/HAM1 family non-canonical purine NTP pyrophosphatase [Bacteroidia bacterium]